MDTLKDKEVLEDMVEQGNTPWRLGGRTTQAVSPLVRKRVGRNPLEPAAADSRVEA
jgi:hypothetical protein